MADSDDEYDRKRRDKFRGERSDYRDVRRQPAGGGGGGDDRRRDEWVDRGNDWNRNRGPPPRPMEYRLGTGRPHEFSPPNKRPRGEWDRYSHDSFGSSSGFGSGYDHPPLHGGYHAPPSAPMPHRDNSDGHPNMLSFKSWLSTQDDSISDQDALTKYAEYKQEFKRQQLNEFFVAHREEEWFKSKYHPDDSTKRKDEQHQNLMKRVNLFMEFLNQNRFDEITLDSPNADKIAKLMDWYVIRLEGGSDEEAKKLLTDEPKPAWTAPIPSAKQGGKPAEPPAEKVESKDTAENGRKKDKEDDSGNSGSESEKGSEGAISPKPKRRKTTSTGPGEDAGADKETPAAPAVAEDKETENISGDEDEKAAEKVKKIRTTSGSSAQSNGIGEDGEESGRKSVEEKKEEKPAKPAEPEIEEVVQLHRTASVFLRNLSPAVPKAEVEALCQKYPGFLRAALADPQPDRRWYRRGWVTFKRSVNIKEICWQLNNIRLKDAELGAIVNRDLTRRVRSVNGITPHKTIVRNDIRLAAQVIQFLDSKWNLWEDDTPQQDKKESFGVYSTNPVLKNITDYLIEEASAEEEELLGMGGGSDGEIDAEETRGKDKINEIDRDEELIKVLDRLILYLRFVHSLDYYNHAEYPYEDDMPNRLGIMHGRGIQPNTEVNLMELQEYNRNFEQKISTFCQKTSLLTDEEVKVLGMKEEATELEKFIVSNTQELGKDKWLCPLSGKKFKGPEFVRKHIENKHAEKLEEVKKEVSFFNNYLRDPKRPKPMERKEVGQGGYQPPPLGGRREPIMMQDQGGYHQPPFPPYGGYGGPPGGGYGGYGGPPPRPYQPYGGGFSGPPRGRSGGYRGRGDGNRPIISYRDLDAPPDDEF